MINHICLIEVQQKYFESLIREYNYSFNDTFQQEVHRLKLQFLDSFIIETLSIKVQPITNITDEIFTSDQRDLMNILKVELLKKVNVKIGEVKNNLVEVEYSMPNTLTKLTDRDFHHMNSYNQLIKFSN